MNKDRRTRLEKLAERLSDIRDELRALGEEEREAFDNMPESLQGSDKGQAVEGNAERIEEAADDLDNIITAVEGVEE